MKKNITMFVLFAIIDSLPFAQTMKEEISQNNQELHEKEIDLISVYKSCLIKVLADETEKACNTEKKSEEIRKFVDVAYQTTLLQLLNEFKINKYSSMIPFHELDKEKFAHQFRSSMITEISAQLKLTHEEFLKSLSYLITKRFRTFEAVEVACLAFLGPVKKSLNQLEMYLSLKSFLNQKHISLKHVPNEIKQEDYKYDFYDVCQTNAHRVLKQILPPSPLSLHNDYELEKNSTVMLALVTACCMAVNNFQKNIINTEGDYKSFYQLIEATSEHEIRANFERGLCSPFMNDSSIIDPKKFGFKSFESIIITCYLFLPYVKELFKKK